MVHGRDSALRCPDAARRPYLQLVSRDLELVTVGIAKINRVRNLVILKFEFDSAFFQLTLRGKKIFPVRAKGEVK